MPSKATAGVCNPDCLRAKAQEAGSIRKRLPCGSSRTINCSCSCSGSGSISCSCSGSGLETNCKDWKHSDGENMLMQRFRPANFVQTAKIERHQCRCAHRPTRRPRAAHAPPKSSVRHTCRSLRAKWEDWDQGHRATAAARRPRATTASEAQSHRCCWLDSQ